MRRITTLFLLLLAVGALALAPEAKLTDYLLEGLAVAEADDLIPCYITLSTQLDSATAASLTYGATRSESRVAVMNWLQQTAAFEQAGLIDYLDEARPQNKAGDYRPFWISNFVFAELTPAAIAEVSRREEVVRINRADLTVYDYSLAFPSENPDPESMIVYRNGSPMTWGVAKINSDAVWDLGYTGAGVNASSADMGHRYTHHDLYDQFTPSISYDYVRGQSDPYWTGDSHGTHCSGTILGNGTAGNQTGVAPESNYGANRIYGSGSPYEMNMWAHWEDAIAWDIDLISISSGLMQAWNPDRPTWRANAQNTIAAGVVLVIAAGNEDHTGLRTPGDIPEVISVGATNTDDSIAWFSSRGPVYWDGVEYTKPDVVAPGVDTLSTWNTGDTAYSSISGTSMAAPHVAGTVALMLEADPYLTPAQVKQVLEETAVDLGDPGKNNTYGSGRIDALAAVEEVGTPYVRLALDSVATDRNIINPGDTVELEITVKNTGTETANNSTGTLVSNSDKVTIIDGNGSFGNLERGESATDSFTINVDGSAPRPYTFELTLNIDANNYDGISEDFYLHIPVLAIHDDVEDGVGYWTHGGDNDSWHISDEDYKSPYHSWKSGSQSGGNYGPNMNASLYSPPVWINPDDPTLGFWHRYGLQPAVDWVYVEINDGTGWTELERYSGVISTFIEATIDLSAYADEVVQLRFRMRTGTGGSGVGWFIDDINLPLSHADATWLAIDTSRGEDGVLVSWRTDADYFAYNVYRESAGESRVMLNQHALKGGSSGSWLDRPDLGVHNYFVEGINVGGESFLFGPVEVIVTAPVVALSLSEPFPNPTPGRVSFNLTVADAEPVSLVVYDISGRRVATIHEGSLAAGRHTLTWDAEAPSGVYLVRLEAAGQTITRRVVLDR